MEAVGNHNVNDVCGGKIINGDFQFKYCNVAGTLCSLYYPLDFNMIDANQTLLDYVHDQIW